MKRLIVFILLFPIYILSAKNYTISGNDFLVQVDEKGNIVYISYKGTCLRGKDIAQLSLDGYELEDVEIKSERDGKLLVLKKFLNKEGRLVRTIENFSSDSNSIHWECEILGDLQPQSFPIKTVFRIPNVSNYSFWTAWGRPQISLKDNHIDNLKLMRCSTNNWLDPLKAIPFSDAIYYYGAPPVTNEEPNLSYSLKEFQFSGKKYSGAITAIPLAVVLDSRNKNGFSFIAAIDDYIQDLTLETSKDGKIIFSRYNHCVVDTNPIVFSFDLVGHSHDWREALNWMVDKYPRYFNPINPLAKQMGGTCAYSNHDADFDIQKMKDMAFTVNWRASFDFPYMGMFLPEVKSKFETWKRFGGGDMSIDSMRVYASKMRKEGFYVLNYFNITEFGSKVESVIPPKSTKDGDEWKNCNDYLYKNLEDAILRVPIRMNLEGCNHPKTKNGGFFYTWEDAIVMDCGVDSYANFLLEQARKHIKEIPESYGFCIDRLDWFRLFNVKRNDGRCMFNNQPASSMILSWHKFMKPFSQMVHDANKVIFVNNHVKRIDMLQYVDGILDEFTYTENALNTSAFLSLKRPLLGWTSTEEDIKRDGADNFFQKYLYMGAFPMCPFPGNDHSIRPSEWVDKQYLAYGKLMKMLNSREWVLESNPVTVISENAKANIFKVNGGFVIPVVFASSEQVILEVKALRNKRNFNVEIWYPDKKNATESFYFENKMGEIPVFKVHTFRGCAMLLIK